MITDDKIWNKKLQDSINRRAAKISALSSASLKNWWKWIPYRWRNTNFWSKLNNRVW